MIESLSRYWWVPVVRGLCGILFGVIAFANPGVALTVLVLWFGAWALVDGCFSVASAIASRKSNADWGFELALLWLIASYAIVFGVLAIIFGIRARRFGRRPAVA